ncbi:MAG: hypothetical protein KGN34_04020 [Sphingomonadales bacterium]|nr:hypothetical protein [Sphingomonadales bacterium]
MAHKSCLHAVSRAIGAILIGSLALPTSAHAGPVQLLAIPGSSTGVPLPSSSTYVLPGYGNVTVSWSVTSGSASTTFGATYAFLANQTIPAAPTVTFGPNVNMMEFLPSGPRSLTINFTFENGQPDLHRLQYFVHSLGYLRGTGATRITPNPALAYGATLTEPGGAQSVTVIGGAIQSADSTSPVASNTGIASFTVANPSNPLPVVGGKPTLSLSVNQIVNDEIGMSLAYAPAASLKLCKVAGDGVPVGTPTTFNATIAGATNTVAVPAGPAPGGYCRMVGLYAEGVQADIHEIIPAHQQVTDIAVASNRPLADIGGVEPQSGRAGIRLFGLSEVTYTNSRLIKDGYAGYVEICKQGGSVAVPSFSVTGASTPASAPVGACSAPIRIEFPATARPTSMKPHPVHLTGVRRFRPNASCPSTP